MDDEKVLKSGQLFGRGDDVTGAESLPESEQVERLLQRIPSAGETS